HARHGPAAPTESGGALATLGIKQHPAARWFHTSERNIRRWKSATRRPPPGVMVTVRLMMAGKVGPADIELAAAIPVSGRTNGGANHEPPPPILGRAPPEPLVEPAQAVLAPPPAAPLPRLLLSPTNCPWPPHHP